MMLLSELTLFLVVLMIIMERGFSYSLSKQYFSRVNKRSRADQQGGWNLYSAKDEIMPVHVNDDRHHRNHNDMVMKEVDVNDNGNEGTISPVMSPSSSSSVSGNNNTPDIPEALQNLVDVNVNTNSVVYEITLGRNMGIEIEQGDNCAIVGKVLPGTKASDMGVQEGDVIVSTSATAGDHIWAHESAFSVKSALNTRFVMSPTVVIRFERPFSSIPKTILPHLKVPYEFIVKLKRPIGLHVIEGNDHSVVVDYVKPDLGAARNKRIEVGDRITHMSASWGDRLWEVNSVESFIVGVKMRTTPSLTFRIRRIVPIDVFTGKAAAKKQYSNQKRPKRNNVQEDHGVHHHQMDDISIYDRISHCENNKESILRLWDIIKSDDTNRYFTPRVINFLMTHVLKYEMPDIAVRVFEEAFDYRYEFLKERQRRKRDHTANLLDSVDREERVQQVPVQDIEERSPVRRLQPNNFVCTTAAKAYGRREKDRFAADKALSLISWMESETGERADVFFLTSVLYVQAKFKRVLETEALFWKEIPRRGLSYTVATTNSLMYMYARMGRPDDALKVYELTKRIGLTCTVVTYGVLIKALLRSGKKALHETSFEILRSLPELNINPGIEVYNQFLEHFAKTHNYRKTKYILRLMSDSKPKVVPNYTSYGHLIHCFTEAKKPRSALSIYNQMLQRRMVPNSYHYMGLIKALTLLQDGLSCVQVIVEMQEKEIEPSRKHFGMTMFACITADQCDLALKVFDMYEMQGKTPDNALYTLKLRALLQLGRWDEGVSLFHKLISENVEPNFYTATALLQYQIIDGRYSQAQETLNLINNWIVSGNKETKSLQGVYQALSYCFGQYSVHVQTLKNHGGERMMAVYKNDPGHFKPEEKHSFFDKLNIRPSAEGLIFAVNAIEEMEKTLRPLGIPIKVCIASSFLMPRSFLPESEK